MELVEKNDWGIDNFMSDDCRREKSISAYHLTNWIEHVREITFETFIYKEIPDILPFEQSIVRYEHKSPSDSPYWGPVTTKEEVERLFKTSIRFQLNGRKGEFYCVRKYEPNLGTEYRCFWNKRLVAVGTIEKISQEKCELIVKYIDRIYHMIPYHRCVLDIAELDDDFILVEFNSWETNSGGYPFSWKDDTELLYPTDNKICFRWKDDKLFLSTSVENYVRNYTEMDREIEVLKPKTPSCWLVLDDYIYISTDIWLGKFDENFNAISWHRGIYRFSGIMLCKDGSLYAGGEYLDKFLCPLRNQKKREIDYSIYEEGDNYKVSRYLRYGFHSRNGFYSLSNNGFFIKIDIE